MRSRIDRLTKPPGSLGRLEEFALRLALVTGDPPPSVYPATIFVLAGDHGVTAPNTRADEDLAPVSAYPREVTAQMCRNFEARGAAIHALAASAGASVVVADLGVDADLGDLSDVRRMKVRRGTRDLRVEAAMTSEEVERAVLKGIALVEEATEARVVGLGEMGIGNTTSASALTAALTGADPVDVVGSGTGVGRAGVSSKIDGVRRGLSRVGRNPTAWSALRELGGLEIAGLVGVTLGAAAAGKPVVTDGFVATSAALVAAMLSAPVRDYLLASHRSTEPGHTAQLDALGSTPALDLGLRLGEGTGVALALPILDAAAAMLREMATFDEAGVSVATGG